MIPFLSNVGFTTVSSSGTLNDKAGTSKSKLPVQVFRLTDNISGNLTMSNDSAHKKIILDTNGNNILNSSGSPITNNSSTALEIIGSGNVQSTLKTFTATQASNSYTGTTTPSNSDSSTVIVDDDHTYSATGQSVTFASLSSKRPVVPSGTTIVVSGSNVTAGTTLSTSQTQTVLGTTGSPNITSATVTIGGTVSTVSNPSTTISASGTTLVALASKHTNSTGSQRIYNGWGYTGTAFSMYNFYYDYNSDDGQWEGPRANGTSDNYLIGSGSGGLFEGGGGTGDVSGGVTNVTASGVTVITTGRRIRFTNNLAIAVAITGDDNPFGSVSVSAGATQSATRDSTDGSFDIVGTISGTNGSSQPYALAEVNNGTGSIVTSGLTGTLSASAL
tara:strand:+ start:1140 stop:2306 length:1167 start_codon:yes stop_codon:yes gene_type:complete